MQYFIKSRFQPGLFLSVIFILSIEFSVSSQTKVVGYVTNDQVYAIDYSRITHLNIAFENPDVNGDLSYSPSNNTYITQAHNNGVKVLVSIAGGGASHNTAMQSRYFNLIKDGSRASFVQKLVTYVSRHRFDGIDVDLEGPAINSDYGKFIAELKAALIPEGQLLTSALSHVNGASNIPDDVIGLFDFINIMAYDATGPWRPDEPGQHSSFVFATQSLDYWISRGLPKEKAVLGVPFYGYGFGAEFNEGISFADILQRFPGAQTSDVVGNTIYYNGIPTIEQKTRHVVEGKYGGIMIWQLAQDATGSNSLLRTIHKVIHNITATEPEVESLVELYPNPVDSILNLRSLGFNYSKVSITDASGTEYLVVTEAKDRIDVSKLPAGLYILRLSNDRELLIKKFTKQ